MNVGDDITRRSLAAARRLLPSVVPLYRTVERDGPCGVRNGPQLLASGVMIQVGGRSFLVTAAHVVDAVQDSDSTLYFGGCKEFTPIEGEFRLTVRPGQSRAHDHFDMAFLEIPQKQLDVSGVAQCISMGDVDVNDQATKGRLYLALGYPCSRGKKMDRPRHKMLPKPFVYSSTSSPHEAYAKEGVQEHSHILIDFDKRRVKNAVAPVLTAPDPPGISGGGVWCIHDYRSGVSAVTNEKLVGILTEWRRDGAKALLATRITCILEAMRSAYSELSAFIPTSTRVRIKVADVHR